MGGFAGMADRAGGEPAGEAAVDEDGSSATEEAAGGSTVAVAVAGTTTVTADETGAVVTTGGAGSRGFDAETGGVASSSGVERTRSQKAPAAHMAVTRPPTNKGTAMPLRTCPGKPVLPQAEAVIAGVPGVPLGVEERAPEGAVGSGSVGEAGVTRVAAV